MNDEPLLTFKSKIEGKNADVLVYVDRIEWEQAGRVSLTRLSGAALTMGATARKSGLRTGKRGTEMIPIKSISSVTAEREGLLHNVKVICSGNSIDFRVRRDDADNIKAMITQLVLGSHPAQQGTPPTPSPPPPPAAAAPLSSATDDLVRLAGLHHDGVLTDAEFAAAKARLLGPPPPA